MTIPKQAVNFLNQAQKSWDEYQDLIKKHEAAEKLRVSQRTIDRYAAQGKIDKIQVADTNAVRFSAGQLDVLFSKKPEPVKPQPIKTTFAKYTNNKKAAPVFPNSFEKPITVQLPENMVTLSAIGCFDPTAPDGIVKIFKWEKLPGSPMMGMLRTPGEQSTEFVSLSFGKYKLRLTLTGSTGISASKDFIVDVQMPKQPKKSDPAAEPDSAVGDIAGSDNKHMAKGNGEFKADILFNSRIN